MPPRLPAIFAALCALAACGERPQQAVDGQGAPPPPATALSARELIDATDAIEKLLAAERTNEAVIVARKLVEKAPAGSEAALKANEVASRAYFTHARLPTSPLSDDERSALLAEAAACAVRSIAPDERDASRIGFAALLASGGGLHRDAARLFDQALEVDPGNQGFLLQGALAAIRDGDLGRARALVARRRAAHPESGWNDGLEAEIALAEAKPKDAVELAQKAVGAERDRLELRLILARALRADRRPADAARLLSALEPAERTKPAIAEQYARALSESGDASGAARAWDEALRANPSDAFVRAECAIAFHASGDEARAAAELELLRAMPSAAKHLARVESAIAGR